MPDRSRDVLEFHEVLARLAGQTSFDGGRLLAEALTPATDPAEVDQLRAETEEAYRLEETNAPGPAGAHDLAELIAAAKLGITLTIRDLERVLATMGVALDVRGGVTGQAEIAPQLAARLDEAVPVLPVRALVSRFERALDGVGGIKDTATPELGDARRRLAAARDTAGDLLRRLQRKYAGHLQESFQTERAGRPVLAVKASARSAVPGLVHDTSATGQTLFVEPFELVEASNRLRELEALESAEVDRILAELTAVVDDSAESLGELCAALAHHDLVLARARLSRQWKGCRVEHADHVHLEGARHPLLDPESVVPLDLPLSDVRVLVVSGPNTGGKTVALKTLGLCALVSQCGLRAPADVARLPVFTDILADIGDDQSIAQSLSTFSAHVRRLVHILDVAGAHSLVLLDEVAGGTDPDEGGPLAQALLERLAADGATVLATTHLGALKEWAAAAPSASNAAVEIDDATLQPTYRLIMGAPGASHALDIATGLGLDPHVVAAARAAMRPEQRTLDDVLSEAKRTRSEAGAELEAARAARAVAEAERRAATERVAELERELERRRRDAERERARARDDAQRELASAREALHTLREQIRAAERAERRRSRDADGEFRERDRRLGAADRAVRAADQALTPELPVDGGGASVGDRVHDPVMGFRGTVVAIEGDHAEVQGPRARVRVPMARLVVDGRPAPEPPRPVERRPALRAASPEIDLRGERAEAAVAQVRTAVDEGAMAGLARVRVIHGRGTGSLRAAVRAELARHPLVQRIDDAPQNEGGDGATYAVLDLDAAPQAPAEPTGESSPGVR